MYHEANDDDSWTKHAVDTMIIKNQEFSSTLKKRKFFSSITNELRMKS